MMTIKITLGRPSALALAIVALQAACSGRDSRARAEGGSIDRTAFSSPTVISTAAPGVQVTRTDGRSVAEAAVYRLTEENFAAFMSAAESLSALERRDPQVHDYLSVGVSNAGTPDAEAGRQWLAANAKARHAIESAGLKVGDYYVASISIANAEQFLNHPKSVAPTPSLARNARLLQSHGQDLAHLRALGARR